jgi:hypothetical protein
VGKPPGAGEMTYTNTAPACTPGSNLRGDSVRTVAERTHHRVNERVTTTRVERENAVSGGISRGSLLLADGYDPHHFRKTRGHVGVRPSSGGRHG